MKHLYIFFWRLDTFEKMLSPVMALCRHVTDKSNVTCTMQEVDCPACRETFIEGLPLGTGKKVTYDEYAHAQAERKRLADEANARKIATQNAAWTTKPTYEAIDYGSQPDWTTKSQSSQPSSDGWTTKQNDGWKTK